MPDVVFVCRHGGAKSLIAAEHFNRIALERGLDVRAACAGLEPYREVPAPVVSGLAGQGIDVSRYTPQPATSETFAGAGLVVHFGCDVTARVGAGVTLEDWGDVPAVSDGFDRAYDIIVQRVERLVETMVKSARPTLVLTASDVRQFLTVESCIAAVETAFSLLGSGEAAPPVTAGLHVSGGGFHIKAGVLDLGRKYFAAKCNGNFPANRRLHDLATIQGVVILADATDGRVLAVVDSVELTARRTAAATAVAIRYLAEPAASTAAIVGCGFQARYQLEALRAVRPLDTVIAVDADSARAEHFASVIAADLEVDCVAGTLLDAVAAEPSMWITCTTSTEFFLFPEHVREGAFVAGVGVDNEGKRELAPALLEQSHVVADLVEQCEKIGDLHHALAAGIAPRSITELGHIVTGKRSVHDGERGIVVFDSTGIGLQDVAACAAVYEAARDAHQRGEQFTVVDFVE